MVETIENMRNWHAHWDAVSEWAGPDDFLKQVKRTVCGRPMDERQVTISTEVALAALQPTSSDILLDLGCGNGLVTVRLAAHCHTVYGIDYSRSLIEIARRHHQVSNIVYLHRDAVDVTPTDLGNVRPTKVSMLAGLQYFTIRKLERLLSMLTVATDGIAPLFFSDVPDVNNLYNFYDSPERRTYYESQRALGTEPMGTWWSRPHLARIFRRAGYAVQFLEQGRHRYAASHRFDVMARPIRLTR